MPALLERSISFVAVVLASPITATSAGRLRAIALASVSTWITLAPGLIIAPCFVVQWLTEAPTTSTTSACGSSSAANGLAKPPEIPSAYGSPANSPFAGADVARIAPIRSPSRSSSSPASASTAPRPAMIAGRSRSTISSAAAAIACAIRLRGVRSGGGGGCCGSALAAGWGWMSIGSISTTGRRSVSARWYARCASSAAVFGLWTRSAIAPTDSTRSCWSIRKFDVSAAAGVSPASTSSGVRLLAASAEPGHRVRQARPLVDADDPDAPGDARVPVGHADGAALVAGVVEAGAAAAQRVGDDQVAAADDAERVLHTLRGDRRADHVGDGRSVRHGPILLGPERAGFHVWWPGDTCMCEHRDPE